MPLRIEEYALIGDTHTAALVGSDGSIDWLCLPRFDSAACFAALLGEEDNGRWLISPEGEVKAVTRRYRPATLVLDTEFQTEDGVVRLTDCMPPRARVPYLVRMVRGVSGRVPMRLQLILRFDYGSTVPWVRRKDGALEAIAGPDAVRIVAGVELEPRGFTHTASFEVAEGDTVSFCMAYHPSYEPPPEMMAPTAGVDDTEAWWRAWSEQCTYRGEWEDEVLRSLITLKALTYGPTGGMVAAPTTSLPERIGGSRNWDYRYCWLRDASFTLDALLGAGYVEEAASWRDWLLRAVAGDPRAMQVAYGAAGERRLPELEASWLSGYEGSRPVRLGNAASSQLQLDVYGWLMDTMHRDASHGMTPDRQSWAVQRSLMRFLAENWDQPDEGIWEVRGPRRYFTHSRVMAWTAFDRAIRTAESFGLDAPLESWKKAKAAIHRQVIEKGYNAAAGIFTQYYGSKGLDAALLMIPLVGFLPASDPRVRRTVEAIQRELTRDGFIDRYSPFETTDVDGLQPGEGAFLACNFWLVQDLVLLGRVEEARRRFKDLLALQNDVGLLSEEYDAAGNRLLGNFPQAFSHVGLVNTAYALSSAGAAPQSS